MQDFCEIQIAGVCAPVGFEPASSCTEITPENCTLFSHYTTGHPLESGLNPTENENEANQPNHLPIEDPGQRDCIGRGTMKPVNKPGRRPISGRVPVILVYTGLGRISPCSDQRHKMASLKYGMPSLAYRYAY